MSVTDEQRAAVVEHIKYGVANDLERTIANLGYPVGLGVAPPPDICARLAGNVVDRISDAALLVLGSGAQSAPSPGDKADRG